MDENMNLGPNYEESEGSGAMSKTDMLKVGGIGALVGSVITLVVMGIVKFVKTYKKGKEAQAREAEYEEVA